MENQPRPFQFRLQVLFFTIGATGVALTLLRFSIWLAYIEPMPSLALRHLSDLVTVVAFGAAVGFLFRHPWHFAIAVGVLYLSFILLVEFDGPVVR